MQSINQKGLAFTDAQGNKVDFRPATTGNITPQGLVVYIRPSNDNPDALEFHIAWEVELSNAPIKKAYVDAVNGETFGVE